MVPEVEVHELVLDDVGDDVPELVHDELVLDEVGDEVLELVLEGVDVQELDVQEPVLDDVVEEDVLELVLEVVLELVLVLVELEVQDDVHELEVEVDLEVGELVVGDVVEDEVHELEVEVTELVEELVFKVVLDEVLDEVLVVKTGACRRNRRMQSAPALKTVSTRHHHSKEQTQQILSMISITSALDPHLRLSRIGAAVEQNLADQDDDPGMRKPGDFKQKQVLTDPDC